MPDPWDSPDWVAATAAAVVGADLGDASLDGVLEVVVPPTSGRPRRATRRPAGAATGGVDPAAGSGAAAAGEVRVVFTVTAGRVVGWGAEADSGPGPDGVGAGEPLVTFTLPAPDAREAVAGTEPSVLFMQGRLKVDGDLRTALATLRATTSDSYRGWLATQGV